MKVVPLLDQVISQAEFAEMVGVSEARVSQMMGEGVLSKGDTAHQWLLAYSERLRDQAAGRAGSETGGLDLVQERAALAREQRIAQALKNQVARGEYAPVGLLADVLGMASGAVVDRFDQLEGSLRKACPGIDEDVMTTVMQVVAGARNQWIRSTSKLIAEALEPVDDEEEEGADQVAAGFGLDDDNVWDATA